MRPYFLDAIFATGERVAGSAFIFGGCSRWVDRYALCGRPITFRAELQVEMLAVSLWRGQKNAWY